MIAVKMMGGLGNQMFQYATAARLAERYSAKLAIDISWFGNQAAEDTPRDFDLNQCNIEALVQTRRISTAGSQNRVINKLERTIAGRMLAWGEDGSRFQPQVLDLPDNVLLSGWFQCEKYFIDYRKKLLNQFTPSYALNAVTGDFLEDIKNSKNTVSLHVRRGDYVSNQHAKKFHGLTGVDYYKTAMKQIESKTNGPISIFVFSDDLSWCKKNLKFNHSVVFVEGAQKSFDDMWLMSHCQHNIIANSSYSWWGAWLNQNSSKIIIAPKTWFQDSSADASDIVPKKWVRL